MLAYRSRSVSVSVKGNFAAELKTVPGELIRVQNLKIRRLVTLLLVFLQALIEGPSSEQNQTGPRYVKRLSHPGSGRGPRDVEPQPLHFLSIEQFHVI